MDVGMLIDAIVRQTTVLIAQLATAGGERTPLSHTANQVFLDLSRELREQGLGSKVVADMFGMALRTYQTKVQRLSESRTDRGRTLWEAIYEHIRQHASQRSIARAELMQRFRSDDPIAVRSVLRDLVDSGLVLRTGRSDSTRYQFAVQTDDPGAAAPSQRVDQAVLMMVHRLAPVALPQLSETLSLAEEQVGASLVRLQAEGRVRVQPGADGDRYLSDGCILPLGGEQGWEVPVFDHYQALVSSLCSKLRGGTRAQAHDRIGGSTYSYQVWPAHPYFEEATGFLASFRARGSALRKKIAAYNADHPPPESEVVRVVVYGGQNVISAEDEQRESMEESDD